MSVFTIFLLFTFLLSSNCVGAAPSVSNTGPVVRLSYGSFQGNATGDLVQFLGMPFAAPPYARPSEFPLVPKLINLFLGKCWESPICSPTTSSKFRWSSPSYKFRGRLPSAKYKYSSYRPTPLSSEFRRRL
jgi:hypothetical protein